MAVVLGQLFIFAKDAHTRFTHFQTCNWRPVKDRDYEPDPYPPYMARHCLVASNKVWLQLYDADGRKLLAERMYVDFEKGSFFWAMRPNNGGVKSLMYSSAYSDSSYDEIAIPPTRLGRLLALMP